jgi:hypothetical protein
MYEALGLIPSMAINQSINRTIAVEGGRRQVKENS